MLSSLRNSHTTLAIIDGLLKDEPVDEDHLRRLLVGVDPTVARRRLLERLCDPAVARWQAQVAGAAVRVLGAHPVCHELAALVTEPSLPHHARHAALTTLQSLTPEQFQAVCASLSREAQAALMMLPFAQVVAEIQEDPEAARGLVKVLAPMTTPVRLGMLTALAAEAQQAGARAADLYRYALADPELVLDDELREWMLTALVAEADEAGSALLTELRATAPKKLRDVFQAALTKLEAARAKSREKVAFTELEAWATNPDGQGAVVAFVSFRNPDKSLTVVDVCFRLSGDLRDGFVEPRATRADLNGWMRQIQGEGSIVFVPAPPGEIARLVQEAAARTTRMRGEIPKSVRRGVEIIGRIESIDPPPAPARPIDLEGVARYFERANFRAWFFDQGDLTRHGATALLSPSNEERYEALRILGSSPMRDRVIAMARYMSRWSSWQGKDDEAAHWTYLTEDVERDFPESGVVGAMAAQSILFHQANRARSRGPKIGPNERCPCGSGKKFKKCCGR